MKYIIIWLIKLYQRYISPLKGKSTCIYYPCCSQYALEALNKHGFFKGTALSIWRVLRCNPFHRGKVDNVPD